jgi:hypothetical protein
LTTDESQLEQQIDKKASQSCSKIHQTLFTDDFVDDHGISIECLS